MTETVLPGVYVDVRPEGLIVPGQVGVGTIGIVGTANRGPLGAPVSLGSIAGARAQFGDYDPWIDGQSDELTMVRALELAFANGATRAVAVRVSEINAGVATAASAQATLPSGGVSCATLQAATPGTWGNDLRVDVLQAAGPAFVEQERHTGPNVTLTSKPILASARTRIAHKVTATGFTRWLTVSYDPSPAPGPGQVLIDRTSGALTFGDTVDAGDVITAFYAVDPSSAATVRVRQLRGLEVAAEETYTVVSGADLARDVAAGPSALVTVTAATAKRPDTTTVTLPFAGGSNGAAAGPADYKDGFDTLLGESVHLMLAAGQGLDLGDELDAHCQLASTDTYRADRIGVIGAGPGSAGTVSAVRAHTLASDRIVLVAPGIVTTDAAAPGQPDVTLPGAYAAAAVAGLLSRYPAHVSLTNKIVIAGGVAALARTDIQDLVSSRALVIEQRQGLHVVRGITTSTNTAWQQITTRRIVDYAKYGVRSAAEPYIGLLNNDRVRGALRATINSFLTGMVDDEMLNSYQLDVSATRDEQIQGIARVAIVLQPVFSIDFIKVTMFLA
jgi:hypothetical protein